MLTKDGSRTLNSERYGETYHSTNGALTEARHVFLDATRIRQRLEAGQPTQVLEIGFGLGLNTLLTSDLADRYGASLNYHSFENALVSAEVLSGLDYAKLLGNPQLADALYGFVAEIQRTDLQEVNDAYTSHLSRTIQLTLHTQDASTVDFAKRFDHRFHAIFLDAFSPDTNSECWSPSFITGLAQVLASDGRLSTYSAKGSVRRAMLAAGLQVDKLAGPPGKREMLVAQW